MLDDRTSVTDLEESEEAGSARLQLQMQEAHTGFGHACKSGCFQRQSMHRGLHRVRLDEPSQFGVVELALVSDDVRVRARRRDEVVVIAAS
jgi:hypothetical protein